MTLLSTTHPPVEAQTWEKAAATAAVLIITIRYSFSPNIPIGFLLAICLLPITARYLTLHRGALIITVLCFLSAISGLMLTMGHSGLGSVSWSVAVVQTVRVLGIALILAALLWARALLGTRRLILTFGLGSLTSLLVTGVAPENPWKFSLSVPVALIALSLPIVAAHRWRQFVVVIALVVVSALNDSRSAAGLLLMAAVLTLMQGKTPGSRRQGQWRIWLALARVVLIAIGAFFVTQAAILEGMLGEAARLRTEAQISLSGSAIIGGRPEMGAAYSLISDRPWGYGAGTLVTYDDRMLGKSGMDSLGYNTYKNGYVEKYMFGHGFEVHSVLGDTWILFGLAGATLSIVIVAFALAGLAGSLSRGTAITIAAFLILRLTWDFAFSPFPSAVHLLPLTVAVALPPLSNASITRSAASLDSG